MNLDVIYASAPPDLAARYGYYVIAIPLAYVIVAMFGILLPLTIVIVIITLAILAAVVIGIWAISVLLLFILWFGLYRYSMYEILYPRLKNRNLRRNSVVCLHLTMETPTICLVRLKPG